MELDINRELQTDDNLLMVGGIYYLTIKAIKKNTEFVKESFRDLLRLVNKN